MDGWMSEGLRISVTQIRRQPRRAEVVYSQHKAHLIPAAQRIVSSPPHLFHVDAEVVECRVVLERVECVAKVRGPVVKELLELVGLVLKAGRQAGGCEARQAGRRRTAGAAGHYRHPLWMAGRSGRCVCVCGG
eukprot:30132-Chlamydomonas_euryale.AAC.1